MSKKKSYINKKNVISEGFFSNLAKILIPAALIHKAYTSSQKRKAKKIEKLNKEIDSLRKNQANLYDDFIKSLEKDTGVKINKKKAEKALDKV